MLPINKGASWLKTLLVKMLQQDKNKSINTKDLIVELSQAAAPDQKTKIFPNLNQNQEQIQSPQQQPQQQQPQNQFIPHQQQFVQIYSQPIQQQQPPPQEKFPTPSKKQQKVIQQQQQIQQQPAFQQQPIQQQSTIQQPTFQQQLQQQQQLNSQQQAQQISIQAEQFKQLIKSMSNLLPKILEIEKIYNNQDARSKSIQEENNNQDAQRSVEANLSKLEEKLNLSFQQLQNLEAKLNEHYTKQIQSKIELYDKEIITQLKKANQKKEKRLTSMLEQQNKQFTNKEEFDKQFNQLQGELHLTNSQISSIKLANDQQIMKQEQLFNLQIQQHINTLKQLYEDFYQQCSVKINDLNKQMKTLLNIVAQSNNQDIPTPFVQVINPYQNYACEERKFMQKQNSGIQKEIFRQSNSSNASLNNTLKITNQIQFEINDCAEFQIKFQEMNRQLEIAIQNNDELDQNLLEMKQGKEKLQKQLATTNKKQKRASQQLTKINTEKEVTKNYEQIKKELKQQLNDIQTQLAKTNFDDKLLRDELIQIKLIKNQGTQEIIQFYFITISAFKII